MKNYAKKTKYNQNMYTEAFCHQKLATCSVESVDANVPILRESGVSRGISSKSGKCGNLANCPMQSVS